MRVMPFCAALYLTHGSRNIHPFNVQPHLVMKTKLILFVFALATLLQPLRADNEIGFIEKFALTADREKALAAGCNGYIEKPIAPETFVTEVEQFARLGPAGEETQ